MSSSSSLSNFNTRHFPSSACDSCSSDTLRKSWTKDEVSTVITSNGQRNRDHGLALSYCPWHKGSTAVTQSGVQQSSKA